MGGHGARRSGIKEENRRSRFGGQPRSRAPWSPMTGPIGEDKKNAFPIAAITIPEHTKTLQNLKSNPCSRNAPSNP